jgi:hypothetical protein
MAYHDRGQAGLDRRRPAHFERLVYCAPEEEGAARADAPEPPADDDEEQQQEDADFYPGDSDREVVCIE